MPRLKSLPGGSLISLSMRARLAIAFLMLAGCAGSADDAALGAEAETALGAESETAPPCDIDPNLADAAQEAIQLWSDAVGTPIPLPSKIELVDFGADNEHAGGWIPSLDTIQISTKTEPSKRAASIAHELGHSLGLEHQFDTGNLMDPDRGTQARLHPCISAELVAAAGFAGPGACAQ